MKTKAELFIDYVQNALILGQRGGTRSIAAPLVWSLWTELGRAARAAVLIPEDVAPEEAARQFVRFLSEVEAGDCGAPDVPQWLREFAIGVISTMAVAESPEASSWSEPPLRAARVR